MTLIMVALIALAGWALVVGSRRSRRSPKTRMAGAPRFLCRRCESPAAEEMSGSRCQRCGGPVDLSE